MSVFQQRATGTLQDIDAAEVTRAASILFDPASYVMIQGLPCARHVYCKGDDQEAILRSVQSFADQKGIYWSLNPCPPGLDHCLKANDVISRRWLLVDVDTDRPDDTNATNDEHDLAREMAGTIFDGLSSQGFPEPITLDSGNGWHLLYRLDLPNDQISKATCREVLKSLGERYDVGGAHVDLGVHDAKRISKMPGTWARKGPHSAERPHRLSKIYHVPESIEAVSFDLLKELAGIKRPEGKKLEPFKLPERGPIFKLRAGGSVDRAYCVAGLRSAAHRVRLTYPGSKSRNTILTRETFSVATLPEVLLPSNEILSEMRLACFTNGLMTSEPDKTISCIERCIRDGRAKPRTMPILNGHAEQRTKIQPKHDEQKPESETVLDTFDTILVKAGTIQPRKIEWLWRGRIPLGKLTTFAGATSIGKTFALCDITARVSKGMDWPDSNGECCEAGDVLFITGEDDPDDTLVPRLIELGADLDRISFLRTEVQDRFQLSDLEVLDRAIEETGPSLKLICIDPPTAFLGDVDDHKNAELRRILSPLKSWAARNRIAIVFITHVNKQSGQKVEALMRVIGSVAWVNAVRAAYMFAKDAEDPERRLFCCMKMNIAKEPKSLAYRMVEKGESAMIEWLGEVDTTADDAVSSMSDSKRGKIKAADWLIERFRDKLEWPSDDLKHAAKEEGISRNALWSAKNDLNVKHRKTVMSNGDVIWKWYVHENWAEFGDQLPGQLTENNREVGEGDACSF